MKVFKFGGASVKDAKAILNVKSILDNYTKEKMVVVISAMGKTTNLLESIVTALYNKKELDFESLVTECRDFHLTIMKELFLNLQDPIYKEINTIFDRLSLLKENRLSENFDFEYDQIVSLGEVVSTKIVAAYLSLSRKDIFWMDARMLIRTNNNYRNADIVWDKTTQLISERLSETETGIFITQGFTGHTEEGFTTTLGREGSDFTAAVFAFCTNAEGVTIWKDVPGMLNADPKWFSNTVKIDKISYKETIELAYYGASVIHPKTIKPLQNKNIPLYIKSFVNPKAAGTIVQISTERDGFVPSFIFKTNQVLLSITPKDFSFIVEENLSEIFAKLAQSKGHINLMQTSAVSFTVCLDIDAMRLSNLVKLLEEDYEVKYNDDLELVTIRHYDQDTINFVTQGKEVFMEQKTRQTSRIVMRKPSKMN